MPMRLELVVDCGIAAGRGSLNRSEAVSSIRLAAQQAFPDQDVSVLCPKRAHAAPRYVRVVVENSPTVAFDKVMEAFTAALENNGLRTRYAEQDHASKSVVKSYRAETLGPDPRCNA